MTSMRVPREILEMLPAGATAETLKLAVAERSGVRPRQIVVGGRVLKKGDAVPTTGNNVYARFAPGDRPADTKAADSSAPQPRQDAMPGTLRF